MVSTGPGQFSGDQRQILAHLINVPARIARSARRITLHLPQRWPWQAAWTGLHTAVHRPARATA
jgi:hypothetical protein